MLIDGVIALLQGQLNGTNQSAYTALIAAVSSALSTDPGTSTGATGKPSIYENELPRGYILPAIAVHQYGGTQDYDFSGPIDINEDQIQLDCYGLDSLSCRMAAEAARKLLEGYMGTLPDGTVVQGLYKERDMAFPYLSHADTKGIANRWMLGFRVVKQRA
jgi:hypothetical protein